MKKSQEKLNRILYCIETISFVIPVIFLALRMAFGTETEQTAGYHSRADYALMIVQCLLGLAAINLPLFLSRQFKFELPMLLYTMYILFLYCAIFLGEVRSFYYVIPNWDSILHGFSSLMFGFFGFMVITILNRSTRVMVHLSPLFAAVFAFCFALTCGALWEVYEFTFDGVLGLNMQKFLTADGTALIGRAALSDTMKDIIIDAVGALAASVFGYFAIRKDRNRFVPKLTDAAQEDQSC